MPLQACCGDQVGGAIGVAVATTVATTFTARYVADHTGAGSFSPAALTHGFSAAFYVLAGMTAAGALIAAVLLESKPAGATIPAVTTVAEESS